MGLLSRFRASRSGQTSVMLALAVAPAVLGLAVGVDMVRTNAVRSVLQGAADAAVLAGAGARKIDDAALKTIVENYLDANDAVQILENIESIEPKTDKTSRMFSVRIRGSRRTTVLHLAGIETMDVGASAEVKLGGDGLEIAMVLDTTGSMSALGRLPALKVAASSFVAKMMAAEAFGSNIRIGVVPFAEYVNVGTVARHQPWLDVLEDSTRVEPKVCRNTYPNAASSNCRDEIYTGSRDGVPYSTSRQVCDWDYGTPVTVCADHVVSSKWHGCVGSREGPLDEKIGVLSSTYPGLMNTTCAAEIVPLTNDKLKLDTTIASLSASGNTYVPAGLLWGWNMVDGNAPLKDAKSAADIETVGGHKAIVLMSDGRNTLSTNAPWHNGGDGAEADRKSVEICKNIKQSGILIYTVSFSVGDENARFMMKHCASDPSKAFDAENAAQLADAFDVIGSSLLALQLNQ